jgi:hypothetical protein
MLLSGLMRNVAITGSTDTINAWFGHSDAGRWAARTAGAAMPTRASEARRADTMRSLTELHERGVITDAEFERLRARA